MIRKERAVVISQNQEAEGIFSLVLAVSFAGEVRAGQFVSLFSADGGHLLPRPVSVCAADAEEGSVRLVYRVCGYGTREFSALTPGDCIEVMGPLGNGFPTELSAGKRVLLVGGGIGIPPMLFTASEMLRMGEAAPEEVTIAAGYRSDDTYLLEELKKTASVIVASDDGSVGFHGTVVDAVRLKNLSPELIFACGPKPMLRAVKEYALESGVPCYISMEEKMACGVGVCLGCVTAATKADSHSLVKNRRVCRDGPVFEAGEVDLS